MWGEHGDSGKRKLAKSSTHRDKFERGHDDVFGIECRDLGVMQKVKIEHDNWGLTSKRAAWHLKEIRVKAMGTTDVVTVFPCEAWISKSEGLSRELKPDRGGL